MDGFHGCDCTGRAKSLWLSSSNPALSRQVPFMPGDEFEELCWEDGDLVLVVPNRDTKPPVKPTSTTALANLSDINTDLRNKMVSVVEETTTNDDPKVNALPEAITTNHHTSLSKQPNDQLSSPTQFNGKTTPQKEFEDKGDDGDDMLAWLQHQVEHAPNTFVSEQAQCARPGSISYLPSLSLEKTDAEHSCTHMQHKIDIVRKDAVQHNGYKWHRIRGAGRESSTITSLSESKESSVEIVEGDSGTQMAELEGPATSLNDRNTETCSPGDSLMKSTITRNSLLGCNPTTENSVSNFRSVRSRKSPETWSMRYRKTTDWITSSVDQKILFSDRVVPDLPSCSKSDKHIEESVLESGAASCEDECSTFHAFGGDNARKEIHESENSKFSPFQGHFRKGSKVAELYNKSKKKWQDWLNMQLQLSEGVVPNVDKQRLRSSPWKKPYNI